MSDKEISAKEKGQTMLSEAQKYPIIWAYKELGSRLNEDFIDRSIEVLARGTGYSREFLFKEWKQELWYNDVRWDDVEPELFINFIIVTLEGDL